MYRKLKLASPSAKAAPQAQAVFLFEKTTALPAGYKPIDRQAQGALAQAIKRNEFSAGAGEVHTLYPQHGPGRLFIVGLGPAELFESNTLRLAGAKLARAAFAAGVQRLDIALQAGLGDRLADESAGIALADGLSLAQLDFDQFKGAAHRNDRPAKPLDLTLTVDKALRKPMRDWLAIGQGVETTRKLAATPPNVANPRYIAQFCRKLARQHNLKCTVIDAKRAAELHMGGLLAVGRAGSTPPALICLEYAPRHTAKQKPILFVGKAVTFDTGGYSLKTSAFMKGMKYDKCGGMTVIGAIQAIAALKLPHRVVGLIPTAENMIDDTAYRIDDILTMHNRVTVEVTNTDAEGRLILADALAYGTAHYKPAAVIDLATLTGGVVVALGSSAAGAFATDEALYEKFARASNDTGEKIWRLPLWNEHRDQMKGSHADIVNSADRKASPIQGAAFLSYFVGKDAPKTMPTLPWVHLDIAGVADSESDTPLYPKGPTGFGVRLLTRVVETWDA